MGFREQPFVLNTVEGVETVMMSVAEETGLGYYCDDEEPLCYVMHLPGKAALFSHEELPVRTGVTAQRIIMQLASVRDWRCSSQVLRADRGAMVAARRIFEAEILSAMAEEW